MRNAKTKDSVQHKIVKERDQIKMAQIRANVRTKADQRKAATKIATKTIMAQNRNNNFGGNQNRNKNKFNKKVKKVDSNKVIKPAVPPRKFRELPEVLEYTEGMNVADIAKKIHREPAEIIKKIIYDGSYGQSKPTIR